MHANTKGLQKKIRRKYLKKLVTEEPLPNTQQILKKKKGKEKSYLVTSTRDRFS